MSFSHRREVEGCAYSIVKCRKGGRCVPKENCPLGRQVFRDRYTGGGHHHQEQGEEDDGRYSNSQDRDSGFVAGVGT